MPGYPARQSAGRRRGLPGKPSFVGDIAAQAQISRVLKVSQIDGLISSPTTALPRLSSDSTIALPIPTAEPVTSATSPANGSLPAVGSFPGSAVSSAHGRRRIPTCKCCVPCAWIVVCRRPWLAAHPAGAGATTAPARVEQDGRRTGFFRQLWKRLHSRSISAVARVHSNNSGVGAPRWASSLQPASL